MAWTTPRTWSAGELVTAAIMNLHVRDNFNMCVTPNFARGAYTAGANHTTTSTSFANVDATNITFNVTSAGGMYWLGFSGRYVHSVGASYIYFDIAVDGTRLGGTNGLMPCNSSTTGASFQLIAPATLTAGTRTITLQWRVSGGTGTLDSTNTVNWFYAGI
jgi:hypothetical protein